MPAHFRDTTELVLQNPSTHRLAREANTESNTNYGQKSLIVEMVFILHRHVMRHVSASLRPCAHKLARAVSSFLDKTLGCWCDEHHLVLSSQLFQSSFGLLGFLTGNVQASKRAVVTSSAICQRCENQIKSESKSLSSAHERATHQP